jgi:heme exporter protein D
MTVLRGCHSQMIGLSLLPGTVRNSRLSRFIPPARLSQATLNSARGGVSYVTCSIVSGQGHMSLAGPSCVKTRALMVGQAHQLARAACLRRGSLPSDRQRTECASPRTCSAISVPTFLSVFIWKCVSPIHDLIVPNGCSTVWRRTRILSGFRSSRACTARLKHSQEEEVTSEASNWSRSMRS